MFSFPESRAYLERDAQGGNFLHGQVNLLRGAAQKDDRRDGVGLHANLATSLFLDRILVLTATTNQT